MKDEILAFYRKQSPLTQPGKYAASYKDLPEGIEALCTIVQGLIIHYGCGDLYGCQIMAERERELDTRYVELMLARMLELDARPLSEARKPQQRLVGCCRDFSVLLCSMLRYQGVPARVRMGFAGYISPWPGFFIDHVVVEYWHEGRWCIVDPQMDAFLIKHNGIDFDVLDMPRGRFLTGGVAWRRCRIGEVKPEAFGIHPENQEIRGWWLVRDKVLQDLAALNKSEMLCWDAWGMMLRKEFSNEEAYLLDSIANLLENSDTAFAELQHCFTQNAYVRLNGHVCSSSPALGSHEVLLTL